jgi:hypothetical protein
MRKRFFGIVFIFLFSGYCLGDVFHLTDGRILIGRFGGIKKGLIRVITASGEFLIKDDELTKIEVEIAPASRESGSSQKKEFMDQDALYYLNWKNRIRGERSMLWVSGASLAIAAGLIILANNTPDSNLDWINKLNEKEQNYNIYLGVVGGAIGLYYLFSSLNKLNRLKEEGRERGFVASLRLIPLVNANNKFSGLALNCRFGF